MFSPHPLASSTELHAIPWPTSLNPWSTVSTPTSSNPWSKLWPQCHWRLINRWQCFFLHEWSPKTHNSLLKHILIKNPTFIASSMPENICTSKLPLASWQLSSDMLPFLGLYPSWTNCKWHETWLSASRPKPAFGGAARSSLSSPPSLSIHDLLGDVSASGLTIAFLSIAECGTPPPLFSRAGWVVVTDAAKQAHTTQVFAVSGFTVRGSGMEGY